MLVDKELNIKIADFGLTKRIGTQGDQLAFTTTLCGTPSCTFPFRNSKTDSETDLLTIPDVAPEILQCVKVRAYHHAVDIWSCGVILYICLCGFPPFSDELYTEEFPYSLKQQIQSGRFDYPSPYWDSVGDPALELIDSMIVVDPKERFSVRQCLDHPWMLTTIGTILEDVIRSDSPRPL